MPTTLSTPCSRAHLARTSLDGPGVVSGASHQLRAHLLAQHECGAKVEPGRFTLSITSAPFTPITRSALTRVYGQKWMSEVEAELPESKRTVVIVEEAG
jgi:hypothetical protein